MSLRARLAAWIDATFWPGLDDRQPCPSVAEVVASLTPRHRLAIDRYDFGEVVEACALLGKDGYSLTTEDCTPDVMRVVRDRLAARRAEDARRARARALTSSLS